MHLLKPGEVHIVLHFELLMLKIDTQQPIYSGSAVPLNLLFFSLILSFWPGGQDHFMLCIIFFVNVVNGVDNINDILHGY